MRYLSLYFFNVSTACNGRSCLFHVVTPFAGEYVMNGLCEEQASFVVLVRNWRMCGETLTSGLLGSLLLEACSHTDSLLFGLQEGLDK